MMNYTNKEINVSLYKDQDIAMWNKSAAANARDDEFKPMIWLGTNEQLYLARTSRDLKKIDQCVVNTMTGEVKVIVFNTNPESFFIKKGMKIAQCVLSRCVSGKWVRLEKVDEINGGDRGNNGFGSTGI
jgi:hypothetical protein